MAVDSSCYHIFPVLPVISFSDNMLPLTAHCYSILRAPLSAGQGLDQSGPDGEKIVRIHLICTLAFVTSNILLSVPSLKYFTYVKFLF